ncbi:MAG TPA: hypothetical protein VMW50_03345 [Dehalococcoidia bacterium]|nr:hypothetical protein [Dehalococcoidia bacterium]
MKYITFGDKIRDYYEKVKEKAREHRETIIRIAVVVAIATSISAIMVLGLAPGKASYNAEMSRIYDDTTTLTGQINGILDMGPLATRAQLEAIRAQAEGIRDEIGLLQTKMYIAENITTTMQSDLAGIICSPPEGYLTGAAGNYTLHAKAGKAGNFTANVHLVYSPPVSVGNATTQEEALQAFYGSINWTAPSLRDYICTLAYNGTAWKVSQVSFNIGTFTMVSNTEKTVGIEFGGLNSSYEPDFAYVEVYPIL